MTTPGHPAADGSIAHLVAELRGRSVSVGEVMARHAERIEQAAGYRAVIAQPDPDDLAAAAAAAQRRIDQGDEAPMLGVPITVKDIVAVRGMPLTAGSRLLRDHRARLDAPAVGMLRRAGAIPVAKTNCPEFGFGVGTSNDLYGTTVNPWGPELLTGGSSGGEAVAVALGLSLLGVGSDFGGSIRWPAQSLGVLGLRPTPGRIPRTGQLVGIGTTGLDGHAVLDPSSLQGAVQVPGLLARTVDDLELALGASACGDVASRLDPLHVAVPLRSSAAVDLAAVAIGIADGSGIGPMGDDMRMAIDALVHDLAADGLRVTMLPGVFQGCREAYDRLRSFDELADLQALATGRDDQLTAAARATLAAARWTAGPGQPSRAEQRSVAWEAAVTARAAGWAQLAATPLVVLPVAPGAAAGTDETMVVGGHVLRGFDIMAHCRAVSLLGAPVLSIPIDRSPAGLPLSVQVVAPPWAEDLVLALGRRLESLRGGCQSPPGRKEHNKKRGPIEKMA